MSLDEFLSWLVSHGGELKTKTFEGLRGPCKVLCLTVRRGERVWQKDFAFEERLQRATDAPLLAQHLGLLCVQLGEAWAAPGVPQ